MSHDILDIGKRKAIWLALSEFYLDIELTEEDFERIAKILKQTDYTLSEIKEIDLYEVFPLLQLNLLSPAGAWAGFDENWLIPSCERLLKKRQNWYHKLKCNFWNKFFYWMRKDYWIAIENRMRATTNNAL